MSRLGFEFNKFVQQFQKIKSFENISIEGIYSHLSSADEENSLDPNSITQLQRLKFNQLLNKIKVNRNHKIKIHWLILRVCFSTKIFIFIWYVLDFYVWI